MLSDPRIQSALEFPVCPPVEMALISFLSNLTGSPFPHSLRPEPTHFSLVVCETTVHVTFWNCPRSLPFSHKHLQ